MNLNDTERINMRETRASKLRKELSRDIKEIAKHVAPWPVAPLKGASKRHTRKHISIKELLNEKR